MTNSNEKRAVDSDNSKAESKPEAKTESKTRKRIRAPKPLEDDFLSVTKPPVEKKFRKEYRGILFIGDPHLDGRVPGFRKDDYPEVVLKKLEWCLEYAAQNSLVPAILGDLFQRPRDNPNWLIVRLIQMFHREIVGIYGNHDVHENWLKDDDSLSLLVKSNRLTLVDEKRFVTANIGGQEVVIGGTPWGRDLPESFETFEMGQRKTQATLFDDASSESTNQRLVFWMAHMNLADSDSEIAGTIAAYPIPGIDAVINGHIHTRREPEVTGETTWFTPGNISRLKRSDAGREHVPSVLRVDIDDAGWNARQIEVPHRPFAEVFFETVISKDTEMEASGFIAGLSDLQARKTETGAGLFQFLEKNISNFETDVADEIMQLAQEVTDA